jgi:hypothetical protein
MLDFGARCTRPPPMSLLCDKRQKIVAALDGGAQFERLIRTAAM